MCVCFLPIHSGHQVRWTYQPGSHRRKVAQDFSSTFLSAVRALIFLARRIQPFLSLVDRVVDFFLLVVVVVIVVVQSMVGFEIVIICVITGK